MFQNLRASPVHNVKGTFSSLENVLRDSPAPPYQIKFSIPSYRPHCNSGAKGSEMACRCWTQSPKELLMEMRMVMQSEHVIRGGAMMLKSEKSSLQLFVSRGFLVIVSEDEPSGTVAPVTS